MAAETEKFAAISQKSLRHLFDKKRFLGYTIDSLQIACAVLRREDGNESISKRYERLEKIAFYIFSDE